MGFYVPNLNRSYYYSIKDLLKTTSLDQVTSIDYPGYGIDYKFPSEIFQLKKLKKLRIINGLQEIPPQIAELRELEEIDLKANHLRDLPKEIAQLPKLKKLNLANNPLETLPQALWKIASLVELDLSSPYSKIFPEDIVQLTRLRKLTMRDNYAHKHLPEIIGQMKSLEILDMSAGGIKKLPKNIGSLHNLRELIFSINQIEDLPESIGDLKNLKVLLLNHNRLKSLPEAIGQLSGLETLELHQNQLPELPDNLGLLTQLKRLTLDKNKLKTFPVTISQLGKPLDFLNFINNPLEWENMPFDNPDFKDFIIQNIFHNIEQKYAIELFEILLQTPPSLADNPLKKGKEIVFAGRTELKIKEIKPQLEQLGIQYNTKITSQTSHVVVGRSPKNYQQLIGKDITFLGAHDVNRFLETNSQPDPSKYLLTDSEETLQNIDKLRDLLLSQNNESILLALELIQSGGFPKALLTELFIAFKSILDGEARKKAKRILEKHLSERGKQAIKARNRLFGDFMHETTLRRSIKKYTQDNELDGLIIAKHAWKLYKKGILYMFDYGSPEDIRALLPTGDTLDFSDYKINKLPTLLKDYSKLKKVYLNNCEFRIFPKVLCQLPQLEILHLNNNWLSKLPDGLKHLSNLQELLLENHNFDTFPQVLLELKNLKKLNIKRFDNSLPNDMPTLDELQAALPNCKITLKT